VIGLLFPLFCVVLLQTSVGAVHCYPFNMFSIVAGHPYFISFSVALCVLSYHLSTHGNSLSVSRACIHPRRNIQRVNNPLPKDEVASVFLIYLPTGHMNVGAFQ